ncbi:hypothetical protein HDV63DRAFT_372068 [Trichoderma sp. SZMC 28014]
MNTAMLLKALLITATTVSAIAPLTAYPANYCDAGSSVPSYTWDTFTEGECYSFGSYFQSLQTGTIAEGCSATLYRDNFDCTGDSYVIDDADGDNCFGLSGDNIAAVQFYACGSQ